MSSDFLLVLFILNARRSLQEPTSNSSTSLIGIEESLPPAFISSNSSQFLSFPTALLPKSSPNLFSGSSFVHTSSSLSPIPPRELSSISSAPAVSSSSALSTITLFTSSSSLHSDVSPASSGSSILSSVISTVSSNDSFVSSPAPLAPSLPPISNPTKVSQTIVQPPLNIVLLLPSDTRYPFSIDHVLPAVELASSWIHHDHGISVELKPLDSECGNSALFALIDQTVNNHPDAILGPVCEYSAAPIARLATHWKIPVLTAGAMAVGFDDKQSEYGFLTRLLPGYIQLGRVFEQLLERLGDRSVVLAYTDDQRGDRTCYFTVEGIFQTFSKHGKEIHHIRLPEEPHPDQEWADNVAEVVAQAPVVILCAPEMVLELFMRTAQEFNSTNDGHIFFSIELFADRVHGDPQRWESETRKALRSLYVVSLWTEHSEREKFVRDLQTSASNDSGTLEWDKQAVTFAAGFHDALLLYAMAASQPRARNNTAFLTSALWNTTFQGALGSVTIDSNGDREGDFCIMKMSDTVGIYQVVAKFRGALRDFESTPTALPWPDDFSYDWSQQDVENRVGCPTVPEEDEHDQRKAHQGDSAKLFFTMGLFTGFLTSLLCTFTIYLLRKTKFMKNRSLQLMRTAQMDKETTSNGKHQLPV
uniref:Receptor ligand binding region domain-containing protein n=1 Tax=Eptatretus burgeri TaxID=7764 RepID=A0A8C4WWS9_EPTBU